jgi:hypothetical protein
VFFLECGATAPPWKCRSHSVRFWKSERTFRTRSVSFPGRHPFLAKMWLALNFRGAIFFTTDSRIGTKTEGQLGWIQTFRFLRLLAKAFAVCFCQSVLSRILASCYAECFRCGRGRLVRHSLGEGGHPGHTQAEFYGLFTTTCGAGLLTSTCALTLWICAACSFSCTVMSSIPFCCWATVDLNSEMVAC